MRTCNTENRDTAANQTARRVLLAMFTLTLSVSLPDLAHARHVTAPDVPDIIKAPPGNHAFREGHAIGTQDYICLSTGWAAVAFAPQATLFNDDQDQIMTHLLSRNPDESNTPRPTW